MVDSCVVHCLSVSYKFLSDYESNVNRVAVFFLFLSFL